MTTGTPISASRRAARFGTLLPPPVRMMRLRGAAAICAWWKSSDPRISSSSGVIESDTMPPARASSGSADSGLARRLSASAVSTSIPSAAVSWSTTALPPVFSVRTKRGTPCSWTTMFVTPAPTPTMASAIGRPRSSPRSKPATWSERTRAKGMRSIRFAVRPAPSRAASRERSMSLWAATTSRRSDSWASSPVMRSMTWWSSTASAIGIGMSSCTWYCRALRISASGIEGSSAVRATTRWFATPTTTFLDVKPVSFQRRRSAAATVGASTTSPPTTAPKGSDTWPKRCSVGRPRPNDTSAARTPWVPMSRPTTLPAISGLLSWGAASWWALASGQASGARTDGGDTR